MLRPIAVVAVLVLAHVAGPIVVLAQDTRVASLEQQRAEKAKQLQPYQPGRIEKLLLYIEREDPLGKLSPHDGFFVQYGYTGRPVGAGMGLSAGYRHDLFDRHARVLVEAGATKRRYTMLRGDFSLPYLARDRFEVGVEATYRHDPQEDFYGLGPDSLESSRVSFLYDRTELQGRAILKPVPGVQVGARFGRINPEVGTGRDSRFPSIEQLFADTSAPGLDAQPDFAHVGLFGTSDSRDEPGNPRAGGYYRLIWRRYSDLDLDRYAFQAFHADLQHFFPIFDKKRVFALRGRLSTTSPEAGQTVPFYMQPTLGGSDSLRSVTDFRFRDNNALAVNVEYRWEATSWLDMALFTDWGQVAARAGDLDLGNLERAYGIGFRFNSSKTILFRADIAIVGRETPQYFLKFSKAF
jgi:outer membrane protein assembly factor BamA